MHACVFKALLSVVSSARLPCEPPQVPPRTRPFRKKESLIAPRLGAVSDALSRAFRSHTPPGPTEEPNRIYNVSAYPTAQLPNNQKKTISSLLFKPLGSWAVEYADPLWACFCLSVGYAEPLWACFRPSLTRSRAPGVAHGRRSILRLMMKRSTHARLQHRDSPVGSLPQKALLAFQPGAVRKAGGRKWLLIVV